MVQNGLCLCARCHAEVEEDPGLHTRLFESIKGEGFTKILTEKKWQAFKPSEGWKQYEKGASKYYRDTFRKMREQRANGKMGRIEIVGYE